MCCFSDEVESVAGTRIFARNAGQGRQLLVYQMKYNAAQELAMILPLPTPVNSPQDVIRFINLEKFPEFFDQLDHGEPTDETKSEDPAPDETPLKVVDVGQFEASFMPTVGDFSRLDRRFRLPTEIWTKVAPQYQDYGFVVFKLKAGNREVHPMAFEFPRRNTKRLFFPTMHIHDVQVHEAAEFDHKLYCQFSDDARPTYFTWTESEMLAREFVDLKRSAGIVDGDEHVYYRAIYGEKKNMDVLV